jgi:AraC-like DNA-binding protein
LVFRAAGLVDSASNGVIMNSSRHWSTAEVPTRDQFTYWREAVCEAVLNVATENPTDEEFSGDIACASYGELRFASFTASAHQVVRRQAHIARSSHEHYLISLQRSGRSRMQQCGRSCELQPGDIGIVDGSRPFNVTFPETVDRVVAVIPSARLHGRAPWLRDRPIGTMRRDATLHPMLRSYIERLAGPHCASTSEAELLSDNLCNLVAVLTARDAAEYGATQARFSDHDRMRAFLHRNFSDPELSPQTLADHMGLSLRTIHKRFEQAETTFGRSLIEARLEAARRALADPRCNGMTVSQIAYGSGFGDLSHFTKAFRARFGAPPGRYRTNSVRFGESEFPLLRE